MEERRVAASVFDRYPIHFRQFTFVDPPSIMGVILKFLKFVAPRDDSRCIYRALLSETSTVGQCRPSTHRQDQYARTFVAQVKYQEPSVET